MIFIAAYFVALTALAITFQSKGWFRLNQLPLDRQPMFWAGFVIPVASFLYFGCFAWNGYTVDVSSNGFSTFIDISKLPLALLSLSIPLLAIIANAHRATQTDAQIQAITRKNASDAYYAHEKNFIERIKTLELGEVVIFDKQSGPKKVVIALPHQLYRSIYTKATINPVADYSPDPTIEYNVRGKITSINEMLTRHVDSFTTNGCGGDVSSEIGILCPLLLMTYEVFDHLGVGNISKNHFFVSGLKGALQLNIGSEPDLKELMQLLLRLCTSVIDIIGTTPLTDTAGIRRYAYSQHRYVFALDQATYLGERTVPTWREAIIPTKAVTSNAPPATEQTTIVAASRCHGLADH